MAERLGRDQACYINNSISAFLVLFSAGGDKVEDEQTVFGDSKLKINFVIAGSSHELFMFSAGTRELSLLR
jgi:hypothetical protein